MSIKFQFRFIAAWLLSVYGLALFALVLLWAWPGLALLCLAWPCLAWLGLAWPSFCPRWHQHQSHAKNMKPPHKKMISLWKHLNL